MIMAVHVDDIAVAGFVEKFELLQATLDEDFTTNNLDAVT